MGTIGLIAGNGRFPILVAEEIRRQGSKVSAIAFREETDPSLEKTVERVTWLPLGQLQKIIDTLKDDGVSTAVMAGQIKHARIFSNVSLDWRAMKLMGRLVNKKTDSILGAVADELSREGITLLPSHLYLQSLLPKRGLLCGTKLSKDEREDVRFGFETAKGIAGLDIGQTVVVKERVVVAVESIEGTDECITRAAQLAGEGVIAVKVAKPKQDFRFDIPVVGPRTVETLSRVRARALAVEAGVTLLIDKDTLLADAEKQGVTIVAV